MATVAELETWIAEAEAARHTVATGGGVMDVWRDGRRLRMRIGSIAELNEYIATLRSELVQAQIEAGVTPTRRRRAIGLAWRN